MITAKCIQKFRDKNNRICGYRLQDQQGYTKDVNSEQLKAAIDQKQIVITNLTLTIDGRLVDSKERKVQAIDTKAIYDSICNTLRFKKCKVLRDDGPRNLCIITKPDIDDCYIKISSPYNSVDDAIINGEVIYGLGDGPISAAEICPLMLNKDTNNNIETVSKYVQKIIKLFEDKDNFVYSDTDYDYESLQTITTGLSEIKYIYFDKDYNGSTERLYRYLDKYKIPHSVFVVKNILSRTYVYLNVDYIGQEKFNLAKIVKEAYYAVSRDDIIEYRKYIWNKYYIQE